MPPRRNKEKLKQLTKFEGWRIIGLREGGLSYRTIGAPMQLNSSVEMRVWKQWADEHRTTRKICSVTSARDDRHLLLMVMNDHTAFSRQLAARWSSFTALETINTRFPPEEWLHIYTDGSLLDFAQGAGIGVFSHLFSFYLHAGPLTTHFDGEVEAIHIALQQLAVRLPPPIERAVILSDSTSALQALSNYNENNCLRVQNCRELLGKIKGKIVFQWVPCHCGLWGNERADFFGKKGNGYPSELSQRPDHSAKLEIKRIFRESFRLTASRVARDKPWSTLCKKSHGIPSSPRAAAAG
ncbi:uncharacterized protein LOC103521360 [Trichonephila clavipes]|nr:uncharacterized protein LOC103521360 [Trichonephila clavipes]